MIVRTSAASVRIATATWIGAATGEIAVIAVIASRRIAATVHPWTVHPWTVSRSIVRPWSRVRRAKNARSRRPALRRGPRPRRAAANASRVTQPRARPSIISSPSSCAVRCAVNVRSPPRMPPRRCGSPLPRIRTDRAPANCQYRRKARCKRGPFFLFRLSAKRPSPSLEARVWRGGALLVRHDHRNCITVNARKCPYRQLMRTGHRHTADEAFFATPHSLFVSDPAPI